MNLFELFVKIGVDDQASGKLKDIGGKLGSGLKKAAEIGAKAVGIASTAIAGLTTAAIKNYAEYEQLVGGAQLMFGKAYDTVAKNAQEAYKTVQMSQNEYLQQVNGFATGLKTALGGNEQAAAELSHKIVQAEADIIAATGNSAENIQNAFNGIMKSNFTMLDNLQIGITPTKEGFQEVIDKVNEWNKANGEATNYQMGNLADMQSALVDYIDMVGMSGYAQAEASKTIQGSLASMKSAWSNLLTGVADDNADFETLVDNFITTLVGDGSENNLGVFGNLLPRIKIALGGIGKLISELAPIIAENLPALFETLLPSLLTAATSLVSGLFAELPNLLETLVDVVLSEDAIKSFTEIVGAIINALTTTIPDTLPILIDAILMVINELVNMISSGDVINKILSAVVSIVTQLAKALPQIADAILKIIPVIVTEIVNAVTKLVPVLITAAIQIVQVLVSNIGEIIQSLVDAIPIIIESLTSALIDAFPALLKGIIDLVLILIKSLPEIVQMIVDQIAPLTKTIVQVLVENAPLLIAGVVQIVFEIVKALPQILLSLSSALLEAVKGIAEGLVDAYPAFKESLVGIITKIPEWFAEKWEDVKQLGKDIVGKIKEGLTAAWETITKVGGWVSEAWEDMKAAFEVLWDKFKEVGGYVVAGLLQGLKDSWYTVTDWADDAVGSLVDGMKGLFGIKSPSKVFAEIGRFIDLGLAEGLNEYSDVAVKAMEDMSNGVVDAFNSDYDMSYSISGLTEPYTGDDFDNNLTKTLKTLVSVEENRGIDVSISVNSDDSELSRMLLSMLKVTAKEVYASA